MGLSIEQGVGRSQGAAAMILYIGVDPDTSHTGIAYIHTDGRIELRLARARGRLVNDRYPEMAKALRLESMGQVRSEDCQLAVEFQKLRPGREKNPNAMMGVQAVAGMALASLNANMQLANVYTPIPSEWKGSIPKEAHQKRILREVGLTLQSPEFKGIPESLKTHVVDALGIALWLKRGRRIS